MRIMFLTILCFVPSFAYAQYPAGYERQTVQTEDEYRLAERLYARFLQRQAEAMRLQAAATEVELSNQRLRDFVCQRFGCNVPRSMPMYDMPAMPRGELPAGYGSVGFNASAIVAPVYSAKSLRYPW